MENNAIRKIIIIVDNDPFIVRAYKSGLEEAGYMVVVAQDGEEAVKQIRALHPDLVLLELILPKLDGFSVLKTIKDDPTVASIPFVVLTTLSQQHDEDEARDAGAADVLVKNDVSLNDVLMHIQRILSA